MLLRVAVIVAVGLFGFILVGRSLAESPVPQPSPGPAKGRPEPPRPADAAFPESTKCNIRVQVCVLDTIPNDPMFASQYGPQKIQAPAAWDVWKGSDGTHPPIILGIVDTGIDCTHPDIVGKCVPGWDFIHGAALNGTENSDDYGHGTHVTSIAAGVSNNSIGVAGICWDCKYMPVKVCDSGGSCPDAAIRDGNMWAADHGAKIINMSLGGSLPGCCMQTGVDYAYGKGVLVISACGNTGAEPCSYPAAFANSMAVSCSDGADNICGFSSRGWEVDVSAPG